MKLDNDTGVSHVTPAEKDEWWAWRDERADQIRDSDLGDDYPYLEEMQKQLSEMDFILAVRKQARIEAERHFGYGPDSQGWG